MQCKQEEYFEGSIFHFYNRTEKNKLLFKCDDDYLYFLRKFKANVVKYPCEIYAYCLMPNHFHFCLKQNSDKPVYGIFNATLISYSHHYNYKYNCRGYLMEKRLQSKRIKNDNYMINLCRYIHYNPVKAGLAGNIIDWKYSNYPEILGKRKGTLYSKELLETYPDEFLNYEQEILIYRQFMEESDFCELLFDER